MDFFKGRTVFIASMHGKEEVIAPLVEKELGMLVLKNKTFDTDQFGTFSGEIERSLSPLDTLRKKCLAGMEHTACDIGIATEGSFGPHPFLFSVPAHEEIMLLIDRKHEWEFVAKTLVTDTNFQGRTLDNEDALRAFADEVQFPSHGILLKDQASNFQLVLKDADSMEELYHQFKQCQEMHDTVYAETDMRAMRNPTRMKVIEQVCHKLLEKLNCPCPNCHSPGFDVVEQLPGLPCSSCQMPTASILVERFACQSCQYSVDKNRRDGRTYEDPMYCSFCNP
jgi:hypothetical protein